MTFYNKYECVYSAFSIPQALLRNVLMDLHRNKYNDLDYIVKCSTSISLFGLEQVYLYEFIRLK